MTSFDRVMIPTRSNWFQTNPLVHESDDHAGNTESSLCIRRRSDYIIGFIAPAIGPNKSKKLTRLIAPIHNIRGEV